MTCTAVKAGPAGTIFASVGGDDPKQTKAVIVRTVKGVACENSQSHTRILPIWSGADVRKTRESVPDSLEHDGHPSGQ